MRVAFVLHLGPTGLGVVRSLGREGIPAVGVDFVPKTPGFYSRYCRPLLCSDPDREPDSVLSLLLKEGEKLSEKGILYACSDVFVLFVSKYRKAISEYYEFVIPPEGVLEGLINKRRMYEEAGRIGIPYPRTFYPRDWADLKEMKDRIVFPAFIKPYYSHLWFSRFNNKGFVVNNYEETVEKFKLIFPTGLDAMIQTVVQGPESNIVTVAAYIDGKGQPLGAFVWRKIRQCPKDFGVASLGISIHDDDVLSEALRFYTKTGYRGIGEIEFKKDEGDREYKMIEMNSRPWLQIYQATRAGVNFPLLQYLDLSGKSVEPVWKYEDDVRWIDFMNDLESYSAYRDAGDLSFGNWVRSWLGTESYAYFAWGDLKPALVHAGFGVEFVKLVSRLVRT